MKTAATYQGCYFNREDAEMTNELRYAQRHEHLDLDGWLKLPRERRIQLWRAWDHATKWQAVALMIERNGRDWDPDTVELGIATWDRKWAA